MENCIFCKIARGDIPADKLYENESIVAFRDLAPQAPVHVLIVPKKHYDNIACVDDPAVLTALFAAAKELAGKLGVEENGYRLVINTGKDGGQTVPHLHIHMLGARELGWPPG